MKHLINQCNLQTRLFNNVTVDVADANSHKQMSINTNHIAWLTGHAVSTRFMLAGALGLKVQEPFPALYENGKGMDKTAKYPSMKELTKDWSSISEKLAKALGSLTEAVVATKMPRPVPTGDTLGDFVSFIMHHEAYTLGQLGIYRRFHGMEAMKYN